MPWKNPKDKKEYQAIYYPQWYAKNGRNRAIDYLEVISEWNEKHPNAKKAYQIVRKALQGGILIKPKKCRKCKEERKLSGHHKDYSKPLEVIWLCPIHHIEKHPDRYVKNSSDELKNLKKRIANYKKFLEQQNKEIIKRAKIVLRLKEQGLSFRQIGKKIGVSYEMARQYLKKIEKL